MDILPTLNLAGTFNTQTHTPIMLITTTFKPNWQCRHTDIEAIGDHVQLFGSGADEFYILRFA